MTVYTIKGLYIIDRIGQEINPTYYGTLEGAIKYANNNNFIHCGEDVKVCIGDYVVAIQKWVKGTDEVGDYWEAQNWRIRRNEKFVELN